MERRRSERARARRRGGEGREGEGRKRVVEGSDDGNRGRLRLLGSTAVGVGGREHAGVWWWWYMLVAVRIFLERKRFHVDHARRKGRRADGVAG